MASSRVTQFRAKANEASKLIVQNYKKVMENNKQYVQDPPTVETCNKLADQLFYTRLASVPHRYEVFWKELRSTKEYLKNNIQDLSVDQYRMMALFGAECYAWFWVGKCVGRGFTFTGYDV